MSILSDISSSACLQYNKKLYNVIFYLIFILLGGVSALRILPSIDSLPLLLKMSVLFFVLLLLAWLTKKASIYFYLFLLEFIGSLVIPYDELENIILPVLIVNYSIFILFTIFFSDMIYIFIFGSLCAIWFNILIIMFLKAKEHIKHSSYIVFIVIIVQILFHGLNVFHNL